MMYKDATPVKEGVKNDFCYIIISGEFQVRKKISAEHPNQDQSYKEFLYGVTAKRSLRSIFNNRIGNLTHKRNLTTDSSLIQDENIFTLSEGQIFGEERICEILAQKKRNAYYGHDSQYNQDETQREKTAPFTIKCISGQAEVFKISGLDFLNILKKDHQTKMAIFNNYKKKRQLLKNK